MTSPWPATAVHQPEPQRGDPLRTQLHQWVRQVPRALRAPSLLTWCALLAVVAVWLDAASTSLVGQLVELREANPVVAAGQELAGSSGLYMVLVSVPATAVVALLCARPQSPGAWVAWTGCLGLAVVKVAVATWNTALLIAMGVWLPGVVT